MKNLDKIITESIRNTLLEIDIVPTDINDEANLVKKQVTNAWRMIYKLMDNVKENMNATYQGKQGSITNQDVDNIIDYVLDSLRHITRITIRKN